RLAGTQPDLERQSRDAVDQILCRVAREIVHADAYASLPAREAATGRQRRDLFDELADVDAQIVLDLAHALTAHDDFFQGLRGLAVGGSVGRRLLRERPHGEQGGCRSSRLADESPHALPRPRRRYFAAI